jgi:O-antigen/teichoic acid export membrane protein|uniref:lipopolysaccharide biosynthesis protein n=1 Tax=Alloprevotella sp. TaxID=1872471 RepID=UPI0040265FE2
MISKILKQHILGGDNRSNLIRKNIIISFCIKIWSALVQLLMVPLTLHCLGVYENGLWLTISSLLIWIDNLDIGLANGLRNKLAVHLALGEKIEAQKTVSSTFYMLVLLFIPIIFLINIWIFCVDTYQFFNVDSDIVNNLNVILHVSAILVCTTFIFKFIGNFYMALQLPAINNALNTLGQTIALLGVVVLYVTGIHSLLCVALINTISPLIVYVVAYPITFYKKYPDLCPHISMVSKSSMKSLATTGIKFFVLQIAGVVLFMSTNILISRFFSPELVTPYQIAYRYFMVLQLIFVIICAPYWTATTDAYKKNDFEWIKKSNKLLDKMMTSLFIIAFFMVIFARPIYTIWIGDANAVSLPMTVIVAVYVMILVASMRYSYILNGFGTLRLQLIMTIIAAVLYIPLATLVCSYKNNLNYLLYVMCAVNLPGLLVNIVQYYKIVNRRAKGIWLK